MPQTFAADLSDVDAIALMLAEHFVMSRGEAEIEAEVTVRAIITRKLRARIQDPAAVYRYFGLRDDEGRWLGVACVQVEQAAAEISLVLMQQGPGSRALAADLIDGTVEILHAQGIRSVRYEGARLPIAGEAVPV